MRKIHNKIKVAFLLSIPIFLFSTTSLVAKPLWCYEAFGRCLAGPQELSVLGAFGEVLGYAIGIAGAAGCAIGWAGCGS